MSESQLLEEWLRPFDRVWSGRADVERFMAFVSKPLGQVMPDDVEAFAGRLALDGVVGAPQRRILRRVNELVGRSRWRRSAINCSGCGEYGLLERTRVPSLGIDVYSCDECGTTWTSVEAVNATIGEDFGDFLKRYSLRGHWSEFEVIDEQD